MSQKGLKEFMEDLKKDNSLASELEAIGSDVQKIIELGKKNGYKFEIKDLQELQKDMAADAEFSDEDLEKVAGGAVTVSVGCAVVAAATMIAANLKDIRSVDSGPDTMN